MIAVNLFKNIPIPWQTKWVMEVANLTSKKEKRIKGEVEIVIVGDSEIKKLNRDYRGKNKITDVLSFAWQEEGKIKTNILGQIYICYPQIKRQAKTWKVTPKEEFARMLVHGLLHLAGHDHLSDKEAKKMFAIQENIIRDLFD